MARPIDVEARMVSQEVTDDLERFRADTLYFEEHRQEFLKQYPDKWVAVYNKRVVGAAKDLKRLIQQLERKGIHPGHACRDYLSTKEELLIVSSFHL